MGDKHSPVSDSRVYLKKPIESKGTLSYSKHSPSNKKAVENTLAGIPLFAESEPRWEVWRCKRPKGTMDMDILMHQIQFCRLIVPPELHKVMGLQPKLGYKASAQHANCRHPNTWLKRITGSPLSQELSSAKSQALAVWRTLFSTKVQTLEIFSMIPSKLPE